MNTITQDQIVKIHAICHDYGISPYTINPDGSIDVDNSVHIDNKGLSELPLKFNIVTGDFRCVYNNLTSLKGAPKHVSGHFLCYENNLTSLQYLPGYIGKSFNCSNNQLTSLEYGPDIISNGHVYNCNRNNLTNLDHCPSDIVGDFHFQYNNDTLDKIYYYTNGMCYSHINIFFKYYKLYEVVIDGKFIQKNCLMLLKDIQDGLE